MFAILKREIRAYFISPISYIFISVFIFLSGILFFLQNVLGGNAKLGYTMSSMIMILIFSVPILTMRLLAEEQKQRTDQLLFTSPVSTSGIVLGKYLAAVFIFLVTVCLSFIFPAILFWLAKPTVMEVIVYYIGFILLGSAFIAICMFASSVTNSQVVAGFLGFALLLILLLIRAFETVSDNLIVQKTIQWLSLVDKYNDFSFAILKISPIIYMSSVILIFLFLTVLQLEKRIHSEGGA